MTQTFIAAFGLEAKRLRDDYFPDLGRVERGNPSDIAIYVGMLRRKVSSDDNPASVAAKLTFLSGAEAYLTLGDVPMAEFLARAMELDLSRESLGHVIKALNEAFVYESSLEITSHGLCRSFRFWSEEEKANYIQASQILSNEISERFPHCCLGFGFVLSFTRGQDFMPHDDDIDLIVAVDSMDYPSITAGLEDISRFLTEKGYEIHGDWPTHRKVSGKGNPYDIDVFVGYREGDYVSFMPGPRRVIKFATVFPPMEVPFLGSDISIPRNPYRYLSSVYGPDWFRPIPGWQHSWVESDYADILQS